LTGRIARRVLLALILIVVALNWTWGRLPAMPRPTGSFVQLAGLKLHYIERPGFGFSTGGYFPFDRQLQAVQEAIDRLRLGHPILVGHSYGGTVSLAFAERHPSEVRGLVLVDAAATCTREGAFQRAQTRLLKVIELPVVRQIASATFSQLLLTVAAKQGDSEAFDPVPVAPAHLHRVLAINMKHGNLDALAGERLAANGVVEALDRGLRGIHVPAIVIQGDHDQLVKPQCGRRLAATLPNARLEMVSGGHMAPYTHPQVIAAAVQGFAGGGYPTRR
jgi:pimeloyl-ACP methyl ester carboxylesterase